MFSHARSHPNLANMEPRTIDIVSDPVSSNALVTDGSATVTPIVSPADGAALQSTLAASGVDWTVSLLTQLLNVTPIWEFALVAVAVLIICVLIGARFIEALSNRDVEFAPMAAFSSETADDVEQESAESDPAHTYEAYISPDTPNELLSDRGQIIRILVENDGRTYQYRIVEETGWSKSKVSRLLSEMHERGEIGKVSVGRENAIVLADHDPDGSDPAEDPSASMRKSPQ
jgi:hypothetical protein